MSLVFADNVAETSVTSGTGTLTLDGALFGKRRFQDVCVAADTAYYKITEIGSGAWETGLGTYSGGALARTTILGSSNGNRVVPLAVGTTKVVELRTTFSAGMSLSPLVGQTALTIANQTQTTSQPVFDATQTWNASGVTFTGWKMNITNTASAAASLFADFQVGGVSQLAIRKDGALITPGLSIVSSGAITLTGQVQVNGGTAAIFFRQAGCSLYATSTSQIGFGSSGDNTGTNDTILTRSAAAVLQLGAASAASPVAQTLQAQGSRAATDSNVGGADLTVQSGTGTGTGTTSSLVFKTPIAGSSGTAAQTLNSTLTLKDGTATLAPVAGAKALVISGATQTTDQPIFDAAQTWNASGVAFTGWKLNITDAASAAASKLLDLQVDGVTQLFVTKNGKVDSQFVGYLGPSGATSGVYTTPSVAYIYAGNGQSVLVSVASVTLNNVILSIGAPDLTLSRSAAATLQLGDYDAASPVAQTLRSQGSRSGTDSNVGGANLTIQPGTGTGTGTLSSIVFKSPVAVGSGTGAQTLTTSLTITNGVPVYPNYTVATLPTASTVPYGRAFVTDANTTLTLGIGTAVVGGGANKVPVYSDGSAWNIG